MGDQSVQITLTRSDALASSRNVALRMGYAICVHGSEVKDLDLVAVPWTDEAASAEELVESVAYALDWIYRPVEERPHGRKGWALRPHSTAPMGRGQDNWYIDLSVMPLQVQDLEESDA